jgi:hypothetical protein
MRYIGAIVVLLGTASFAFAGNPAPEIDGNSAAAAAALISGGLLVLRGRRKR